MGEPELGVGDRAGGEQLAQLGQQPVVQPGQELGLPVVVVALGLHAVEHRLLVGVGLLGNEVGDRVAEGANRGEVALHVRAKRYRCAVEPDYHAGLSAGSTLSLQRQGGPLTADEVAAFEQNPGHEAAVLLRGWDDAGKVEDLHVAALDEYRPLLERVAASPPD